MSSLLTEDSKAESTSRNGSGAASAGALLGDASWAWPRRLPHARVRNQSIGTHKMGSGSAYAPALRYDDPSY